MYNGPNSAPPADTPVELLAGEQYLTESLLGFKFRVSALSFFQVNTFAAEKLYAKVRGLRRTSSRDWVCTTTCSAAHG